MHATAHRGGRKPWIYTITLHPALGIQNLKLTTKRQFSLMQVMLYANIRRKTSAFLKVFAIMLQITCSDAIETKQLWKWNSPLLSNLDKIGFRYAKQDFSKSLKTYCRYLCSQQRARTKRFQERDKVRCKLLNPPDASPRCHEIGNDVFSTHKDCWQDLSAKISCHDALLWCNETLSMKLDQISARRDIPRSSSI